MKNNRIWLWCFTFLVATSLLADFVPLNPQDKIELGKVTRILWKEESLTEADSNVLKAALRYQGHDDVRSTAMVAVIARQVPGYQEIMEDVAQNGRYTAKAIASRVQAMGAPITIERLAKTLQDTNADYRMSSVRNADDFIRDILVDMMVIRARAGDKAPFVLPEGVAFDDTHKSLAELAFKPEAEAWEFLRDKVVTQKASKQHMVPLALALSSYSKLFYDEAMEEMESAATPYQAKLTFLNYLNSNEGRMSAKQQQTFKETYPEETWAQWEGKLRQEFNCAPVKMRSPEERLLDQVELGKIHDILWKEGNLTEEDTHALETALDYDGDEAVPCTALAAAIARNAPGLRQLLENTASKDGHLPKAIATRFLDMGGTPTVEQLTAALRDTNAEYRRMDFPTADDYYRDILVDMMVLQARAGDKAPFELPEGITFNTRHKYLAKLAAKPEVEAWDFAFQQLKAEGKKASLSSFLPFVYSLSCYSKVFYDQSMKAMASSDLGYKGKLVLFHYLTYNQGRLSPKQWMVFIDKYPDSISIEWASKARQEAIN